MGVNVFFPYIMKVKQDLFVLKLGDIPENYHRIDMLEDYAKIVSLSEL